MIIPWSDHCAAIPGFHAFTWSDYTASFNRKGKVRPLALLQKNQNAIQMFSKLGNEEVINDEQCADAEKLVCSMYGQKNLSSVAEARLEMFPKKYKPRIGKNPISCAKKMAGISLPPCSPVIRQSMSLTHSFGKLKELVICRVMFHKPALLCRQFVSVLSPAH